LRVGSAQKTVRLVIYKGELKRENAATGKDGAMRHALVISCGFIAIAGPTLAQTSAEQLNAAELQRITTGGPPAKSMPPPAMTADPHGCPPGTYWEEAGYALHAKWRPAHCATK
jgi:hypothetical protein